MDTWMNDIPMTDEEKLHIELLHKSGCKCELPLLGFIPGKGPRCRMCGVEVKGYGYCSDCAWFEQPQGCNVVRNSDICKLNKRPMEEL